MQTKIVKMLLTFLIVLFILSLSGNTLSAQIYDTLTIGFWNVENLFDLVDDPTKNDDEFTPQGKKHVTEDILDLKLDHLAQGLMDLDVDILGLAEVENREVMELLNYRYIQKDYQIIHYDSPDRRGIDVGLFYNPNRFKVVSSKPIRVPLGRGHTTRDILYVEGEFAKVTLHIFVNHWPSHWGGTEATKPLRRIAAETLRQAIDNILSTDPTAEIVVIGDLNDNPTDVSVKKYLGCTLSRDSVYVGGDYLWNLMKPFLNKFNGGSYKYRGKDKVIDQIIVSPGMADNVGLTVIPESLTILDTPIYRQQTGKFAGYPFRFWVGDNLLGGYSDHLAVKVSVIKN